MANEQNSAPAISQGEADNLNATAVQDTQRGLAAIREKQRQNPLDPARNFRDAPPNFGSFAVPQIVTFASLVSSISKAYRNPDEAYRHSIENARTMRTDLQVMECLEARQRACAGLGWHLEIDGPDLPYHKALKERLTYVLEKTPRFTEYRRSLLEGLWYGRQANQHKFAFRFREMESGGKQRNVVIHKWLPIQGDKLVFRMDYGDGQYPEDQIGVKINPAWGGKVGDTYVDGRRVEMTEYGMAVFLQPWERGLMAVHKHMIEDGSYEDPLSAGSIHGVGIRSRIYWTWFQKQELLALFMEYLERSALGFEIWYYDSGNPNGRAETEAAATNRIGRRNIVLFPKIAGEDQTYGVEHIEPGASGAEALQRVLNEFFGHQIKRYILGQTLTSEASATGLGSGLAELHLATLMDIIKYDATNLEETITTDLVDRLKVLNDPRAANVDLRFVIDTQSANADEKMAGYEKAYNMGCRLREADVMEAISAAMPDRDEPVLQKDSGRADSIDEAEQKEQEAKQQQAEQLKAMQQGQQPGGPEQGQELSRGKSQAQVPRLPGDVNAAAKDVKNVLDKSTFARTGEPELYKGLFDESEHPRADDGKFSTKPGSGATATAEKRPDPAPRTTPSTRQRSMFGTFDKSMEAARKEQAGMTAEQKNEAKAKAIHTPEFNRWFGDWQADPANASKVVDREGKPEAQHEVKRVFHGTGSKFEEFTTSVGATVVGRGYYFAENVEIANNFAQAKGGGRAGGGANVLQCFLNIRKPYDFDEDATDEDVEKMASTAEKIYGKEAINAGFNPGVDFRKYVANVRKQQTARGGGLTKHSLWSAMQNQIGGHHINTLLRSLGHDGITHRSRDSMGTPFINDLGPDYAKSQKDYGRIWIAFKPEQIKSATGNRGTFDPTTAKLTHARDGSRILYAKGDPEGTRWITLNGGDGHGTPVLVDGAGNIHGGPKELTGKNVQHLDGKTDDGGREATFSEAPPKPEELAPKKTGVKKRIRKKKEFDRSTEPQAIEFNGKTQSLSAWAEELDKDYNSLYKRIVKQGWSPEKAFNRKVTERTSFIDRVNEAAEDYGVDAEDLKNTAEYQWEVEYQKHIEREAVKRQVREMTGLTQQDVGRIEDAGFDYASGPNRYEQIKEKLGSRVAGIMRSFDAIAQETAAQLPELGIGDGRDTANANSVDIPAAIWEVLQEGRKLMPPKHDPAFLRRVAEYVQDKGGSEFKKPKRDKAAESRGWDDDAYNNPGNWEPATADDDEAVPFARKLGLKFYFAKPWDESEHPRADDGKFGSGNAWGTPPVGTVLEPAEAAELISRIRAGSTESKNQGRRTAESVKEPMAVAVIPVSMFDRQLDPRHPEDGNYLDYLKASTDARRVASYAQKKIETPIVVAMASEARGGGTHVSDGGHRLLAAIERGDEIINAIIPKRLYDKLHATPGFDRDNPRTPHARPTDLKERFSRAWGQAAKLYYGQMGFDWDESQHPRDPDGKFTDGPGAAPKGEELEPDDKPEPDNPREAAAAKVDKTDYAWARPSAVSNAGEDLLGSARHKRNAWKGLAQAEEDGTAATLLTRDNLLKAEPHNLMAGLNRTNALPSIAMGAAIAKFPPKVVHRRGADAEMQKLDRQQYYDAYRELKAKAEELAASETDPRMAMVKMNQAIQDKIVELRGGVKGEQQTAMAQTKYTDPYNATANQLVKMYSATYSRSGEFKHVGQNHAYAKVNDFVAAMGEKYGTAVNGDTLDKMHEHTLDVLEGTSVAKSFGKESGNKKRRWTPADMYVKYAKREGGRVIDAKTVEAATKFMTQALGMRGIQFGNSMTDDERQHHLTRTSEAFADLTDVLGLPDGFASLEGKLGIAFGARGIAGAMAHYEPANKVINLTRKNGVGTLAHEWGHFFDHTMGGGGEGYGSRGLAKDPELNKAFIGVRKAMQDSGFECRADAAVNRIGGVNGKYWKSTEEKFARVFERYVDYKLRSQGRLNTYLSGINIAAMEEGEFWPTDDEVKAIAPAMDAVFAHVAGRPYEHYKSPPRVEPKRSPEAQAKLDQLAREAEQRAAKPPEPRHAVHDKSHRVIGLVKAEIAKKGKLTPGIRRKIEATLKGLANRHPAGSEDHEAYQEAVAHMQGLLAEQDASKKKPQPKSAKAKKWDDTLETMADAKPAAKPPHHLSRAEYHAQAKSQPGYDPGATNRAYKAAIVAAIQAGEPVHAGAVKDFAALPEFAELAKKAKTI